MAQLWNKITANRLLVQLPSYIIKTSITICKGYGKIHLDLMYGYWILISAVTTYATFNFFIM